MKNYTKLLVGAVSFAAFATTAQAADAVIEPVVSGYNWSGLYVGAGIGVGAVVHGLELEVLDTSLAELNGIGGEGFFGELSIGYDYQVSPRFVIGAFADAHYGNIGPELSASPLINADLENVYGFDVGGRRLRPQSHHPRLCSCRICLAAFRARRQSRRHILRFRGGP